MDTRKYLEKMILLSIILLNSGCGGQIAQTPTPNIQGTVDARVALIMTETSIAQIQRSIAIEKTAIEATRVSLASAPTPIHATPASIATQPVTLTPTIGATVVSGSDGTITAVPSIPPVLQTPMTDVPTPQTSSVTTTPIPAAVTGAPNVVSCPFYIYVDWGSSDNHYVPEGWMGDWSDIQLDDNYKLDPLRSSVIRITYTPQGSNHWAGIYWWDPPGSNWAQDKDGEYNLSCATKLTFWARGENSGEKAEFKVGGLQGKYRDSLQPALSTGPIVLTNEWTQYTIDLTGKDLSHIIGGFVWVTNVDSNPDGATIYLDDIRFE
jgi:hypothetical protein